MQSFEWLASRYHSHSTPWLTQVEVTLVLTCKHGLILFVMLSDTLMLQYLSKTICKIVVVSILSTILVTATLTKVETYTGQGTVQSKAQLSRNTTLGSCLFPHHLQFGRKHRLAGLSHFSFSHYHQRAVGCGANSCLYRNSVS